MECREERFAYLVLLCLSFSTLMFSQTVLFCGIRKSLNCQSNCKEAFGENSGGVLVLVLGTTNIHKTYITLLAWLAICNIISQERREY